MMTVSQYNCPECFTILTSALLNQIASFSSSDCHWSCKSCKCQWTACTWNFHFFVMYSHLLGQINCTVGIGWLSTMKTQLCCFLNCLGSGISVMLLYDNLSELIICPELYLASWRTGSLEILSQNWESIRKQCADNQWLTDWVTTGVV